MGCNATVWICLNVPATAVSAAGTTRAVVSVTYVGICPSMRVNKKCHVLSASFIRYFGMKTGKGAKGFEFQSLLPEGHFSLCPGP